MGKTNKDKMNKDRAIRTTRNQRGKGESKNDMMKSLGLTRVKGSVSRKTYWE